MVGTKVHELTLIRKKSHISLTDHVLGSNLDSENRKTSTQVNTILW
ncbi:unnamed protein product [Hymenolepis diminuta]|uniref:Uncharacterized protein n=1 Tax=Hymenolepis diminuta TaxID=6216 RepID=A0A0R3SP44_HYMDI|nr:unnamed protein product [Hymenolepis diminuta]